MWSVFNPWVYYWRFVKGIYSFLINRNTFISYYTGRESLTWKPATLRAPMLLSLSGFTLALIAVLEYLSRVSQRDGGVAFSNTGFSPGVDFLYLYLPTILAVTYSMLWAWVDLDVKRLEPYFQMSKDCGALPANSLFLHYPFDFVAMGPVRAFRRRHWSVFFAGTVMIIVFWAITPLVGSIFASSMIIRTTQAVATTTAGLRPLRDQFSALSADFMMTAYESIWLGQDLPAFTTADAALLPFRIDSRYHPQLVNETWTATTKMYSTSLICNPAIVKDAVTKNTDGFVLGPMFKSYDNGKGCLIQAGILEVDPTSLFTSLYIGYYMDQHIDYSLSGMGCSAANNSHTFFALWAENTKSQAPNITALFCEPAYWVQTVNATVSIPNMAVSNIVPLESPVPLESKVFNITNYEYIIGTGSLINAQRVDIPKSTSVIDQRPQLAKMGINSTITNMVGFAIGTSRLQPAEYLDAKRLALSFESAHKILFALAIGSLFSASESMEHTRLGVIQGKSNAIVVVRVLAIIVESFLALVTAFAISLLCISSIRHSQLKKDPASLSDMVELIVPDIDSTDLDRSKPDPLASWMLHNLGRQHSNDQSFLTRVIDGKLYLGASERGKWQKLRQSSLMTVQKIYENLQHTKQKKGKAIRPLEMTAKIAFVFILVLLLAITTLAVLWLRGQRHIGLPMPSDNSVVNQVVLNYVPIVLATFLEPFWVLLNRSLCVLKPFEELRMGDARASESLDVRYTSLPPQLTVWRALRARHFLLAAVCGISISANVLAVSLSGLFGTSIVTIESNGIFASQYLPIFNNINGTDGSDHIYIAKSNFSDGTALPPWVSRDRFFLPFSLGSKSDFGNVQSYNGLTQGFGIDVKCDQVDLNTQAFIQDAEDKFVVDQQGPKGNIVQCNGIAKAQGGQNNSVAALEVLETVATKDPNATKEDREVCETTLVAGFLRANLTVTFDNFKTDNTDINPIPNITSINSASSLWLTCRPTLRIADYEVIVDTNGRVQSYTRKASYSTDLAPHFTNNFNLSRLILITGRMIVSLPADTGPYWHNDTFVDSWFGYYVKRLTNSTRAIDPSMPVPAFDFVAPVVEDIYTRLFAIILGAHADWFLPAPPGTTVSGTMLVPCMRVFISRSMFIIAITLLCLNVAVAVAYYAKRPKRMLLEMPDTIASVLKLFDGSGLVAEKSSVKGWQKDWKFGYGRFVGIDGKPRLGIERRPFVVPWADESG